MYFSFSRKLSKCNLIHSHLVLIIFITFPLPYNYVYCVTAPWPRQRSKHTSPITIPWYLIITAINYCKEVVCRRAGLARSWALQQDVFSCAMAADQVWNATEILLLSCFRKTYFTQFDTNLDARQLMVKFWKMLKLKRLTLSV